MNSSWILGNTRYVLSILVVAGPQGMCSSKLLVGQRSLTGWRPRPFLSWGGQRFVSVFFEGPSKLAQAKTWKQLSDFTFTFHFHALEKELATHSSVLAWRIPGTGEPGGLLSMGSHGVGHD